MKKIIILCSIAISGFSFAQENSDNPYIYEESSSLLEEDVFPSNPGDPNPAPIDEYVPALLVFAIALIFIVNKKSQISE